MPVINNTAVKIEGIPFYDLSDNPSTPPSGKTWVYTKADGLYLKDDAGTVTGPLGPSTSVVNDYVQVSDVKAQNTAGGALSSGSWQTRDLNTEVFDGGGCVTVASNQVTIVKAGKYRMRAVAPAYAVNQHQLKLYNVSTASDIALGPLAYSNSTNNGLTSAEVSGEVTLSVGNVIEVRHRVASSKTVNGAGIAGNWGPETYTVLEMWRVS